ncbi:MAG: RNA 2'-phosphotransferase [Firmicutes bacterium]|nr:RNA 2'-phosphotransferase [Bacillota bacterium]
MSNQKISIYISMLLRHRPEEAQLTMDEHGWVSVESLIHGINTYSKYKIDQTLLEEIVFSDNKGRFRFNEEHTRIKACQGHSIDWVIPKLSYLAPPEILYHGTTRKAWEKIQNCGYISKMKRHAVHMSASLEMASRSAKRWKNQEPVVLSIDAQKMQEEGYRIGVSENAVWCIEKVDTKYILEVIPCEK